MYMYMYIIYSSLNPDQNFKNESYTYIIYSLGNAAIYSHFYSVLVVRMFIGRYMYMYLPSC